MARDLLITQGYKAVVDDDCYDMLSLVLWHASKTKHGVYAKRSIRRGKRVGTEYMHRVIMNAPPNLEVDHINGDTLDNRRENLRLCLAKQNNMNKKLRMKPKAHGSKYKGTTWCKADRAWRAQFSIDGKVHQLGRFATEAEAAVAYNEAAVRHYGEFAKPNIITEELHDETRPQ